MASLIERKGSKNWFLKYRDAAGQWRMPSLQLRRHLGQNNKSARQLCAAQTARELLQGPVTDDPRWAAWVPRMLDFWFGGKSDTLARNRAAWDKSLTNTTSRRGLDGRYHYVPTAEGWLYVAGVLDLDSRKLVGWAAEDAMPTALVARAFERAVTQPSPTGRPAALL